MLVDSFIITQKDAQMLINKEQLFGHDTVFQEPPEPPKPNEGKTNATKESS